MAPNRNAGGEVYHHSSPRRPPARAREAVHSRPWIPRPPPRDNASLITFLARGVIGTRFVMAGVSKVFVLGPVGHYEQYFTGPYLDT